MSGRENAGGRRVTALSELPQAIEPPRDLWPAIAARLEMPAPAASAAGTRTPPRAARLRWLAAAAMLASVAVGVWIGHSALPLAGPGAVTAVTPAHRWPPSMRRRRSMRLMLRTRAISASARRCCARSSRASRLFLRRRVTRCLQALRLSSMPRKTSNRRSAGIRAMHCCRSCSSTLIRMRCASSATCVKPATWQGDLTMRIHVLPLALAALIGSSLSQASEEKVFDRTSPPSRRESWTCPTSVVKLMWPAGIATR